MKYITPLLETDRLVLKRGILGDYYKVYEYDFRKLRNINNEFEMVKQNLENLKGFDTYADEEDEVFDWIVYLKENGAPIANITADRENKNIKSTEIAFNMHPDYWKNGYMSEAIIRVLEFLFEFGFENVMCGYSEGNINSKRIGDKLGFVPLLEIPNAWEKDGISITDYKTIMSKEKFKELYRTKNGKGHY
ncbi:MAG: GNAT family N-acetyltransferase [Firmicutes bacterium]|nr:GNAT family N-acetyltransferase [Bacillota bacterium]